jgi:hypothetical protein
MTTELQQALLRVADASCGCSINPANEAYNAVETLRVDGRALNTMVNTVVALLPNVEARELYNTTEKRDRNGDGTVNRAENNSVIIAVALQLKNAGLLDDDPTNDRPEVITPSALQASVSEQYQLITTQRQR